MEYMAQEEHRFHVNFEKRPLEIRDGAQKTGFPTFIDQEIAVITMPGGQLVVEKEINEKLLNEWRHGDNMRKPPSPFAIVAYEAWKAGDDIPINGIDLKNWPGVTPAQLKMCHNASIYSVEDLRDANADCIRKLGMGALALIEKAKAYLGSAQTNKASEEISALKVDMEAMKATIEKKDEQIAALMDKLGNDSPRQTRRSRNKETGELE